MAGCCASLRSAHTRPQLSATIKAIVHRLKLSASGGSAFCPLGPFCPLNDLKDLNDINALVHNLTLVGKKYQQALGSNGTKEKLKKESTAEKIAPAVASYLVARKTGNSMIKVPSLRFKGIFMLYWIAPCIR